MISKKVFCDEKGKYVIIEDYCDGGFPTAHSFNSLRAIANMSFAGEFAPFYCECENDCYEGDNVPPKCAYRKLKGEATLYLRGRGGAFDKGQPGAVEEDSGVGERG